MPRKYTAVAPGMKFGRLTVIDMMDQRTGPLRQCNCRCECGSLISVFTNNLSKGNTKSCGCLRRETTSKRMTTHGERHSTAYRIWAGIKSRCGSPTNKAYAKYGGRGITVCKRWSESFENFLKDMGEPGDSLSIDRIDNEKGYEPGNCRWATRKVQNRNKSNNRMLTYDGRTQDLASWAEEKGMPYNRLYLRIKRGWSAERAIESK